MSVPDRPAHGGNPPSNQVFDRPATMDEFGVPEEILESLEEIVDGSDTLGVERTRLEALVRVLLNWDRSRRLHIRFQASEIR